MDRPVLHTFVDALRAHERFQGFAQALPTRARVSEPILPLILAAVHEELERPLVCLLPDDADARDAAEAAGWFLGTQGVALFPSRGVSWGSGLEPPPHLVGERARALDVLAGGGLVCASAEAVAEGLPPAGQRPETLRLRAGDEPGFEELAERLALAGYERVERVEERGQFAVRGGLIDVFPSTGREPLRIELFGDEIEGIRAFSPFTQRALRPIDEATIYPAAERRLDLIEPTLDEDGPPPVPRGSRPAAPRRPGPRLGAPRGRAGLDGGARARRPLVRGRDRARAASGRPALHLRGAASSDCGTRARRGRERAPELRPFGPARGRRLPAPRRSAPHAEHAAADRRAAARAGRGASARAPAPLRDRPSASRLRLA